jgi:zinc protease
LEGTQEYNSKQFAQKLDELGAYFGVDCGKDYSSFTLHVLNKNLEEALNLIYPIFIEPVFDPNEFENLVIESKQDFEHNLHNTGFIARQELKKLMYQGHPYGKLADMKSFDKITLQDIKEYATKNILQKKYKLYLSGKVDHTVLQLLENKIKSNGKLENTSTTPLIKTSSISGLTSLTHGVAKQDAVRIGLNIPNQDHPDFLTLNLINTILGGYFGARLMQNIREEKGWTYGISSSIVPGKQVCSLMIGTDVLLDKGEDCIAEIKKEVNLLRNTPVSDQELSTVNSYIKGNLLRSFDGVFQQMDRHQSTHLFGLTTQHYTDYMKLLNTVTPKQIQEVTNRHLDPSTFTEVLVSN